MLLNHCKRFLIFALTGADHLSLHDLLENQQWEKAEQETLFVMKQVLTLTDGGGFVDENFVGNMNKFPVPIYKP